jgi:hypothetical protein
MQSNAENGAYFLLAGFGLLSIAVIAKLVRDTRGLSLRPRCRAMGSILRRGFVRIQPSRLVVCVLLAWFGGFILGMLFLGSICFLGLRWYASTLPVATEVYEGFGDAMMLLMYAYCCLVCSLIFGVMAGFSLAIRTYERLTPSPTVPLDNSPLAIKSPRPVHE